MRLVYVQSDTGRRLNTHITMVQCCLDRLLGSEVLGEDEALNLLCVVCASVLLFPCLVDPAHNPAARLFAC